MKKLLNALFIACLLTTSTAIAQIVSTSAFLQGAYLEVGMQRNGSMGSGGSGSTIPSGYHAHGSSSGGVSLCGVTSLASVYDWGMDGWTTGTPRYMGDYTLPGSPWEGWAIEANTTMGYSYSTHGSCGFTSTGSGALTGGHTSWSSGGGRCLSYWDGSFLSGDLVIKKEHRIDTLGAAFVVTVKLYNVSSTTITGVYYFRSCDPDNSVSWGGSFTTLNTIPYNTLITADPFNRVMVTATATPTTASVSGAPPCPISLATKDCRAKALIYNSWPFPQRTTSGGSAPYLSNVFSQSGISSLSTTSYNPGTSRSGDIAIGIVFNLGDILPGDSTVFSYAYIYNGTNGVDTAFPEPQLTVNGNVVADTGDTAVGCPVAVDIINGDSKNWTWTTWTWAPATGLASTTGTSNVINPGALGAPVTYTITATFDSADNRCPKQFMLTVLPGYAREPRVRDTGFCFGGVASDLSTQVTLDTAGAIIKYFTTSWGGTGTTIPITPSTGAVGVDTYWVSQTIGGCESQRVPIKVTIRNPPTIFLANYGPYCPGSTMNIILTDTSGATSTSFAWTGPGGFRASTRNITRVVSYADSGDYTVVATLNGCPTFPTTTTVVVHNTPGSPGITNPTYCQFVTASPLVATGSNILWYTSATGGVGSSIAPTPSTSAPGVFTYYVTQTVNGCESARYPVRVTVNPKPAPPVVTNNPGNYCPGDVFNAFTYAAGTGTTRWYAGPTGGTGTTTEPRVNTNIPDSVYTFYVSQTLLGCEGDRAVINIRVYDSVKAHYTTSVRWGCDADTVTFNNTSYNAINYRWELGDGSSSNLTSPTHIYRTQGIYVIKLYAHSAYCFDSLLSTIDTRHPIRSHFGLTPQIVCQGDTVRFSDSSIGGTKTYLWSFGDGNTSTAANPKHIYQNTGQYVIRQVVRDFVPCYDTSYNTVMVDSATIMTVDLSDTAICRGASVTIEATYAGGGNTDFLWKFGNGDSLHGTNPVVYAYPTTGVYTITATARYRVCPEVSVSKQIYVAPVPVINVGMDTSICEGSSSIFLIDQDNAGNTNARWLWSTGDTTAGINITNHGIYWVKVDIGGCAAIDTVKVRDDCYLTLPNCFTPNEDGVNDFFNPRDFLMRGLKKFKLTVYNRWGQVIFESTNLEGRGWDGKFNDTPQPQGVYIYSIEADFIDGKKFEKHGNITLIK